jgi:hypothetical protein
MKSTLLLALIGLLATSTTLLADERASRAESGASPQVVNTGTPQRDWYDHGMQVVSNDAGAGEPGHGWRYFSDPAAARAVVISPQGEYFYSRGKGLRLVAATQRGA